MIVLFSSFTGLAKGESLSPWRFAEIPISILLGVLLCAALGLLLAFFFQKVHVRDSVKVLLLLSFSFLLVALEDALEGIVPISGLIAVMSLGIALQRKRDIVARRLSLKFSKLWVGAELLLLVLVGATVDLHYAYAAGLSAVILIFGVLLFRMAGVWVCLFKTKLLFKERLFCVLAYMPKATVQAAIGSVPLSMGLSCGNIVLTVAVLAILITAPLGAFLIDLTYKKLLSRDEKTRIIRFQSEKADFSRHLAD